MKNREQNRWLSDFLINIYVLKWNLKLSAWCYFGHWESRDDRYWSTVTILSCWWEQLYLLSRLCWSDHPVWRGKRACSLKTLIDDHAKKKEKEKNHVLTVYIQNNLQKPHLRNNEWKYLFRCWQSHKTNSCIRWRLFKPWQRNLSSLWNLFIQSASSGSQESRYKDLILRKISSKTSQCY